MLSGSHVSRTAARAARRAGDRLVAVAADDTELEPRRVVPVVRSAAVDASAVRVADDGDQRLLRGPPGSRISISVTALMPG